MIYPGSAGISHSQAPYTRADMEKLRPLIFMSLDCTDDGTSLNDWFWRTIVPPRISLEEIIKVKLSGS